MPTELKIPDVGESITQVQISEWVKAEGDEVKQDETVAVIDSEKTTFDLPAPKAGRLTKILHQAGETVNVGEVVAELETNGEATKEKPVESGNGKTTTTDLKSSEKSPPKGAPQAVKKESRGVTKEKEAERTSAKEEPEIKSEQQKPEASPTAKEPADQTPEDKAEPEVKETKPAISPKPSETKPGPAREEEITPMTMLRRTVAHRLVEAQQTMAMLTTFNEVDMSATQTLRQAHQEAFEKRHQVKLGLMSFFVKAAIAALKEFPQVNAEIRGDDIVYHNYFDIGVAIATDRGLVVPVLRQAERMSFAEVERGIGDFARRARDGKLKPDELAGGTFTITNGGVFGSLLSTPIINPPQTGILGLHAIQERPVAVSGQVVIRPMMYLALTYDHRLVDGREAVLFLRRVKELIETPARMLMEI